MRALLPPVSLFLYAWTLLASLATADQTPAGNSTQQLHDLCDGFRVICSFVAASCDPSASSALDAKCLESFQLYYEHSHTLSTCSFVQATSLDAEEDASDGTDDVAAARSFLTRYAAWQTSHVCEMFHATEAKAARSCSGDFNRRSAWRREEWPLFCRSVFATYAATRHQLDALCPRSSHSDAFWTAFAEFSGSDTCRSYYADVRAAIAGGCGDEHVADEACTALFERYTDHQAEVERDCLELRASRIFYRGFYKWKKAAHANHHWLRH